MARASGSAAPAYAAASVFGLLFLMALGFSILFYAQIGKEREIAREAEEDLEKYRVEADERKDLVQQLLSERREEGGPVSVVSGLIGKIERLRRLITGSDQASYEAILADIKPLGIMGEGGAGNLMREINRLQAEKESAENLIADLEERRDEALEGEKQANAEKAGLARKFDESVSDLQARLRDVQSEFDRFRQDANATIGSLEERLEEVRGSSREQVVELRDERDQLEQQARALQQRIDELTASGSGADFEVTRLQPDGQVVSVLEGEEKVYLNRGRDDQVVLGMTFEIFSSDDIIKLDDFDELRGKGTIEIISISERSSVARIVRLKRGSTINEGDVAVNLVYDPDTIFKFFVHGDFDLERDGQSSPADLRRVETMVENWGGRLARDLTYDVDFLLLGLEPEMPEPLSDDVIDPVLIQRHLEAERTFERYQELIAKARELSIPVLNQNRFLALIGFYER